MKNYLISAGIAVVVALVAVIGFGGSPVENLGAASSPAVENGCMDINGVSECSYKSGLVSASTTCSIKSPNATSTLVSASLALKTIPTGATMWGIGQSRSRFATTTPIVTKYTVATGKKAVIVATTTVTALTDGLVAPATYINFKIATGTGGTYAGWTPVGTCSAKFRTI